MVINGHPRSSTYFSLQSKASIAYAKILSLYDIPFQRYALGL